MERINEDGSLRPLQPHELANLDQVQAHFETLTSKIVVTHASVVEAVQAGDQEEVARLTSLMGELTRAEWPEADSKYISYIMYLISMLDQARIFTSNTFEAADSILSALATIVPPAHPLHDVLNEWNARSMPQESRTESFFTGEGQRLTRVHPGRDCEGTFCVVHRPVPGPWDQWPTSWNDDLGLMMRRCPHGKEHVAMEELLRFPVLGFIAHPHTDGCDCPCDFGRLDADYDDDGNLVGFKLRQ